MKTLQSIGLVLGFFGIVMLFNTSGDAIATFGKSVDLYAEETDITKLDKWDYIETEVYLSLDYYASEETTTTRNGSVTGRSYTYFYLIPAFSGDDTYWIGVKVRSADKKTYDKIVDETYDYLMDYSDEYGMTTIELSGRLKKQDDDLYKYMTDWFSEAEWFDNDADIEKYVLPLYIDPYVVGSTRAMFFIGIGGVLLGVLAAASMIFKKKQ